MNDSLFDIRINTLTDMSKTYDVVFRRGNSSITDVYHAADENDATRVCTALNLGLSLGSHAKTSGKEPSTHRLLFRQTMKDWMAEAEGDSAVSPDKQQHYIMEVAQSMRPEKQSAITVTITPENGDCRPAVMLFIEINQGLPCVHLSNEEYADNLLHIFSTREGFAVVPDNDHVRPEYIETARFYEACRDRNSLFFAG